MPESDAPAGQAGPDSGSFPPQDVASPAEPQSRQRPGRPDYPGAPPYMPPYPPDGWYRQPPRGGKTPMDGAGEDSSVMKELKLSQPEGLPVESAGNGNEGNILVRRHGLPLGTRVIGPPRLDEILAELPGVDVLNLFAYLKSITMFLPDDVLADYLLSDERVQLEYIIDRLSGKPGLKDSSRVRRMREGLSGGVVQMADFREYFEFLETLVEDLPDQGFAVTIKNRLERLRTLSEAHAL